MAQGYNLPNRDHAQTVADLAAALKSRTPKVKAQFVTWFESNKHDGDWRMRPFSGAVSSWKVS